MALAILVLTKAHIGSYTRKDGAFVQAHDDKRQAAHPRPIGAHADALLKHAKTLSDGNDDRETITSAAYHMKAGDHEALKSSIRHADTWQRDTILDHIHPDHWEGLGSGAVDKKRSLEQYRKKFGNEREDLNAVREAGKAKMAEIDANNKKAADLRKYAAKHEAKGFADPGGHIAKLTGKKPKDDVPEPIKTAISSLNPDDWDHHGGKSTYRHGVKWGGHGHDGTADAMTGAGFERADDGADHNHEVYRHPAGHEAHLRSAAGERYAELSIKH